MMDLPDFLKRDPEKKLIPELESEREKEALLDESDERYLKMRKLPYQLQRFLWAYGNTGKVHLACRVAGVSRTTVYKCKRENKTFEDLWETMVLLRDEARLEKLEEAAFKRAVKGVKKGVWYKGDLVGYERQYSDGLLTTLLKAHAPEKYRERTQVDHSGEVGVGLQLLVVPQEQSVDDWSKNHGKGVVIEHDAE